MMQKQAAQAVDSPKTTLAKKAWEIPRLFLIGSRKDPLAFRLPVVFRWSCLALQA